MKVLKKESIIENDEISSIRTEKHVFQVASEYRHPFLIYLHSCFQTAVLIFISIFYYPSFFFIFSLFTLDKNLFCDGLHSRRRFDASSSKDGI